MRVRYKVVESEAVDLRPQACDSRKAVQQGSLSDIRAAFPYSDCFVWDEGCWEHIDDSTAELVVDGSCLKVIRKPVMAKVTLAVLVTLALPALVYSHLLSSSSIMSTYRATPEGVSTWEIFEAEVTAFCATLDDSNPCHDPVPFPKRAGGAVEIQSEVGVNFYVQQYLYQPLENAPPLPGFVKHAIVEHHAVTGMIGQPDYAAIAYKRDGQPQLLFAAESKTRYTLPIPPGTTTAEIWQDSATRGSIVDAVEQVFGYMLYNDLSYSLLTSGEAFVFMRRTGRSLQLADVRRTSNMPTPMAAIYYLMQRAAEAPGKLLRLKKIAPTDATYRPQPTFGEAASAATWVWQQLGQMALHAVSWGAVKWLLQSWGSSRHAACAKKVWSLQELGLAAEIACGRTGHVYEGRINGKHVAVKVGDYAADKRVLQDLQHEAAVYEHLRGEQGVSVPRFVACGYIMDSTLYFIATELLGPSLDSAAAVEKTLELTALHALDRVHSCGVLHRDVRAQNFLRSGPKGVMLADLAFAELSADPRLLRKERRDAPHKIKSSHQGMYQQSPMLPMAKMFSQIRLQQ